MKARFTAAGIRIIETVSEKVHADIAREYFLAKMLSDPEALWNPKVIAFTATTIADEFIAAYLIQEESK